MATANNEVNPFYNIAHQNDTAKSVFSEWATRLRDKKHVDIGQFRRKLEATLGDKFNRKDFEQVFKALAELNAGHIAYSAKGFPKYFVLRVSLKDMGRAGNQQFYAGDLRKFISRIPRESHAVVNRRMVDRRAENVVPMQQSRVVSHSTLVVIPMAEDRIVKIEVPEDLTAKELGLITSAVSALKERSTGVS